MVSDIRSTGRTSPRLCGSSDARRGGPKKNRSRADGSGPQQGVGAPLNFILQDMNAGPECETYVRTHTAGTRSVSRDPQKSAFSNSGSPAPQQFHSSSPWKNSYPTKDPGGAPGCRKDVLSPGVPIIIDSLSVRKSIIPAQNLPESPVHRF